MTLPGCFIVFEGVDGAGKSKQVNQLREKLQKMKYEVIVTKEPTETGSIGKLIQDILFKEEKVTNEALALLFAADRAVHTRRVIIPALNRGAIVISDRYVYSSLAYQSSGITKINLEWLKTINKFIVNPDVIVYLDISPETGMERLKRGQKRVVDDSYFDTLKKQNRIREAYKKILNLEMTISNLNDFSKNKKRYRNNRHHLSSINGTSILNVNGEDSIENIHKEITSYILPYLRKLKIHKLESPKKTIQPLVNFSKRKIPA